MMIQEIVMIDSKICCDCGENKPITEFNICNKVDSKVKGADKIVYRLNFCGKCAWIRRKKAGTPSNYYYSKNPEAWNAYQREYAKRKRQEKKRIANAIEDKRQQASQ